ncbi:hypothetical protein BDZ45DRAFT_480521 [Acephala macrosclerotiorum]|nr:hypothetical protein BDZ45DRAFT_480521 [Acephala macrosclerotiorum]
MCRVSGGAVGGAVTGAGDVVIPGGRIGVGAGGIEVEDRRGFDGGDGDVGQGRDSTVAYDGRTGEAGRVEERDGWVWVSFEVGRRGVAVACSDDGHSRDGFVGESSDRIGDGDGDGDTDESGDRELRG